MPAMQTTRLSRDVAVTRSLLVSAATQRGGNVRPASALAALRLLSGLAAPSAPEAAGREAHLATEKRRHLRRGERRWSSTMPLPCPAYGDFYDYGEEYEGETSEASPFKGAGGAGSLRAQGPIYVAATKQHAGKTTTSLALMSGLMKRFPRVGFLKPVGQQCLSAKDKDGRTVRIDKDVVLVKEHFGLDHLDYRSMSPIVIERGYTKDYIDGNVDLMEQMTKIGRAYESIRSVSDAVLCEGTGHCAVGSIVGACNARVASLLGAKMVLVANGGLGSTFDELELNRALCHSYGVDIAGVIVNRVQPDKYDQTYDYLSRALLQYWGVPLLGCIPDQPFLGCPALADMERLFRTSLVSGHRHRSRHYKVCDISLVTTSLRHFLEGLRADPGRMLHVTHVTRDDIILGFLEESARMRRSGFPFEGALLVCGGAEDGHDVAPEVVDALRDASEEDAPVMLAQCSTRDAVELMHKMTPKLNVGDTNRVEKAVQHYEPCIDFETLLERTSVEVGTTLEAAC